ncbi:hypothetical protein KU6B_18960 [Mameliella alba]|uniref:DUF4286 family protein n=1 Tax=Mameliella alba TaxID=561184 RepID=UPI0013E4501D|nr:DUF4286 family protein [Mameliella alba]BBU55631.1 hypothetical protein KU6B_18960 [Mameliella alba]
MKGNAIWLAIADTADGNAKKAAAIRETDRVPALPGFGKALAANRYAAFNVSRYLLEADLERLPETVPDVPTPEASESLLARKRSEFRQTGVSDPVLTAPILYTVRFKVPQAFHEEFEAWYDQEHIPMILECPDWAGSARYSFENSDWTHLAMHYVTSADALDGPAMRAARKTPWRNKFLEHDWFGKVDKSFHFRENPPA